MINRLAGQYHNTSHKLTFYTSENQTSKIQITEIAAKRISHGFAGFAQWLDPTRVSLKITDKNNRRVSISVHNLAKMLEVSFFRIILARLNPFSTLEKFVSKKLRSHKFSSIVVKSLAKNFLASHPDEKVFKIARKKFPFLNNSYLVEKTSKGNFRLYRFERIYYSKDGRYHNKLIGEGGFKKVKELTNIVTARKMALAVRKKGEPKKFEDEIQLHEQFQNIPNFAQGKRVTWLNSKSVKKTGILMPRYSGTMASAAYKVGDLKAKQKCSLQIALAIKHLFDNGLFHLDIKPDNIFIHILANGSTNAYLGDLGGIRKFTTWYSDAWDAGKSLFGFHMKSKNNIHQNGLEYTPLYSAPELVYSTYSEDGLKKAVIYSLGKTLLKWHGNSKVNPHLKSMLRNAISNNPKIRPDIDNIIHRLKIA